MEEKTINTYSMFGKKLQTIDNSGWIDGKTVQSLHYLD